MRLFSYIVSHDTGFAPNPFWGFCTLACCKPKIRSTVNKGDIIVGLSPKISHNRIIYTMRVTGRLSFKEYFQDMRFSDKIPDMNSTDLVRRCGDNIYKPNSDGTFTQIHSFHSNRDGTQSEEDKKHDINGKNVLVSTDFSYFGSKAMELPKRFSYLIIGNGHRSTFTQEQITAFDEFFKGLPKRILGLPSRIADIGTPFYWKRHLY